MGPSKVYGIQKKIIQYGWKTEVFHPRSVLNASSKHIPTQIRQGAYAFIWIILPSSGRAVPPNRRTATLRDLSLWILRAQDADLRAALFGLRGKHWQDETEPELIRPTELQQLVAWR